MIGWKGDRETTPGFNGDVVHDLMKSCNAYAIYCCHLYRIRTLTPRFTMNGTSCRLEIVFFIFPFSSWRLHFTINIADFSNLSVPTWTYQACRRTQAWAPQRWSLVSTPGSWRQVNKKAGGTRHIARTWPWSALPFPVRRTRCPAHRSQYLPAPQSARKIRAACQARGSWRRGQGSHSAGWTSCAGSWAGWTGTGCGGRSRQPRG